jgi:hypothetical protein
MAAPKFNPGSQVRLLKGLPSREIVIHHPTAMQVSSRHVPLGTEGVVVRVSATFNYDEKEIVVYVVDFGFPFGRRDCYGNILTERQHEQVATTN